MQKHEVAVLRLPQDIKIRTVKFLDDENLLLEYINDGKPSSWQKFGFSDSSSELVSGFHTLPPLENSWRGPDIYEHDPEQGINDSKARKRS